MGFDFSDFADSYISDLKQALDDISMDSLKAILGVGRVDQKRRREYPFHR
jgi:hypothetical protein